MNVFGLLGIVFLLAFLVEAMVEYIFGTPMQMSEKLKPYSWLLMYVALAVGLVGSFRYHLDIVYILAQYLKADIQTDVLGIIFTGLMIGRGSNFVHDVIKKFFGRETPITP